MDVNDLTREQAQRLAARLSPMLGYLTKLTDRMQKAQWRASDEAYAAAWKARDAMHELCVRLRYQACGNPGRQPPRNTEPPPRPWEPGGSGREG